MDVLGLNQSLPVRLRTLVSVRIELDLYRNACLYLDDLAGCDAQPLLLDVAQVASLLAWKDTLAANLRTLDLRSAFFETSVVSYVQEAHGARLSVVAAPSSSSSSPFPGPAPGPSTGQLKRTRHMHTKAVHVNVANVGFAIQRALLWAASNGDDAAARALTVAVEPLLIAREPLPPSSPQRPSPVRAPLSSHARTVVHVDSSMDTDSEFDSESESESESQGPFSEPFSEPLRERPASLSPGLVEALALVAEMQREHEQPDAHELDAHELDAHEHEFEQRAPRRFAGSKRGRAPQHRGDR